MRLESAGLTDVGRRRPHNEDAYMCDDGMGLYVVADGVGGHAKGEIASQEAVEQIQMWVKRHLPEIDEALAAGGDEGVQRVRRILESGIQQACYFVFGLAELDPGKRGMSTTLSALLVRNGHVFIGQVGDSRVYRMRGHDLMQLTEDHTLINYKIKQGLMTPEEAKSAKGKNVITRAVGHKDYVQVDVFDDTAAPGDRFLLCTDGMHGYVDNPDEIAEILGMEPGEGVTRAITLSNARGGRDNITAIIVSVLP